MTEAKRSGSGNKARGTPSMRTRSRRVLRAVALLLMLALLGSVAGGGYWIWQEGRGWWQEYRDMATRLDALEQERVSAEDFQQQVRRVEALEQEGEAMQGLLSDLRQLREGGRPAWLLAEVRYLLRGAHWNLRLQGDPDLSLEALRLADARLAELADPALLPVREALAGDIVALEGLPRPDVDGMAMKLSQMSRQTADWPLQTPGTPRTRFQASEDDATSPADADGWQGLLATLAEVGRGLVVVRRHDGPLEPLLPPEQVYFQRLNAALHLDGARVALLRRDPALFQEQVATSADWIGQYFDVEHSGVAAALENLNEWRDVEVAPERPDITAALEQLRELERERTGDGE